MRIIVISAPQSREHGDDLLLSGHYARKEYFVVLGFYGERVPDGVVVAEVEKDGTFDENVGKHEDDHVVAVLLLEELHGVQEFFLPLQHLLGIYADDLRYTHICIYLSVRCKKRGKRCKF